MAVHPINGNYSLPGAVLASVISVQADKTEQRLCDFVELERDAHTHSCWVSQHLLVLICEHKGVENLTAPSNSINGSTCSIFFLLFNCKFVFHFLEDKGAW